jgi:HEAT repeat protein
LGCAGEGAEIFIPLIPRIRQDLKGTNQFLRDSAPSSLAVLGRAAHPAVPDLIEMLSDPFAAFSPILALGSIGTAAVPALDVLERINRTTTNETRRLLSAISAVRIADAQWAKDFLVRELRGDEGLERQAAGLRRVNWHMDRGQADFLLPTMMEALDSDLDVFHAAIDAIHKHGNPTEEVLTKVRRRMPPDGDENIANFLMYLHPGDELAFRVLTNFLNQPGTGRQQGAIRSLGELGPPAKPALPHIQSLLTSTNEYVRREAKMAIRRIEGGTGWSASSAH